MDAAEKEVSEEELKWRLLLLVHLPAELEQHFDNKLLFLLKKETQDN